MVSDEGSGSRGGRVFVSSTFIDDKERRKVVNDAIVGAGMVPVGMEHAPASSVSSVQARIDLVQSCDWLVGIIAYRYGEIPEGQERSFIEIEYDAAAAKGIPRLMFVLDGSVDVNPGRDFDGGADRWKKQEKLDAFKARFSAAQTPGKFRDETLGTRVLQALIDQRNREAAPAPRGVVDDTQHWLSKAELKRYLAKAQSLHHKMQLVGFEQAVRVKIELDDLYVPLDAMLDRGKMGREVFDSAQHADLAKGEHAERCSEFPLAEAFTQARAKGLRGLIVLGDPGSGKTTHLKQVLLKVIRDGPESIGLPVGTVPVFLPLRNLRDRSKGVPGFIQQELQSPLLDVARDFGERLCGRGRLLYLLDGLDEVASSTERAEVARWIGQALAHGPESYFLVSCRYAGYTKEVQLDDEFLELHLRPLNDEQMEAFVTSWYAIVEAAMLADPKQAATVAKTRTKDLLETLAHTDFTAVARVYEMTRNPLLLTAICLVHRDRGRLPRARARAKLYEESIAVLLERWKERFAKTATLSRDEAVGVLQPVAHWMHEQRCRRATKTALVGPVSEGLARLRHVRLTAEPFLAKIRDESGLLTGWGVDEYGFMHLGFQEFLTAERLRNERLKQARVFEELAGRFGDSWWQEVILLMLALRNPSVFEELMRAVVQRPEFAQWAESELMQLCMAEAAEPSAAPFMELLSATGEQGGTAGLEARQLAAAKVLGRSMPEALAGLEEVLAEHPADSVRGWWRARQGKEAIGSHLITTSGGVELMLIPGGTFMMGSPDGVGDGDERPQHRVELAGFYLARTPVTNGQYGEYLRANPSVKKPRYWGNQRYNQPEQPVVGVSWHDARAYCEWAGLSLPTEAQWEYACRAGTTTAYWSGDSEEDLARVGWHHGNSGNRLHAVAELEPNEFGLYDMHGNVLEWCLDGCGSYTVKARPGDGLRVKPESDADRVVRGGGWLYRAGLARSASRGGDVPGDRYQNLGFRPVQVIS